MHKVISFSLWGNDPRYTWGALQNAILARIVYPEWICRFYVGTSTSPEILSLLEDLDNVKIIRMKDEGDWRGMFWRFFPASDDDVDVVIVRDCDSRLWLREKEAVEEWLRSDKDFHIMRDHPNHNVAILGGMWGVRNGLLKDMKTWCSQYEQGNFWQVDQDFLRDKIFPLVETDVMVHESDASFHRIICRGAERRFPSLRDPLHFVGQAYAGSGRILDASESFFDYVGRELESIR